MGQKVNPKAFRLGQHVGWSSVWYAKSKDYAGLVRQDVLLRKFLKKRLKEALVEKVELENRPNGTTVTIIAGRPGVVIGRGGAGIENLRQEIIKKFFTKGGKHDVSINIKEVENPSLSAEIIMQNIITDIEKRLPFRRAMKHSIERVMKSGALGVRLCLSGRLNGAEIARREMLSKGRVPLHTIRADIDYARGAAHTTYGAIGVKVWIYKGEVFAGEEKKTSGKILEKLQNRRRFSGRRNNRGRDNINLEKK
jgi:small subunit ribosomal protein S3